MKRFVWEWHCEWIDAYEDVVDRDYGDIGSLKKFAQNEVSDLSEAVYMLYGLTIHWNGDGTWTDIEQERAYINEKSEFDLSELDRKIPKYIMKEFEEHKHLLKPQGIKPHYEGVAHNLKL